MNETNNGWLSASGTATLTNSGYSGNINNLNSTSVNNSNVNSTMTIADGYSGFTLSGTSINSLNYTSTPLTYQNMRPQQVKVAVFTIKRDKDTNEIKSTKFVKELWIERKNGTSIDLIVAKQLEGDFDPENTVVREILTVSF